MNDLYSPHTGEHIQTDTPADWMGRAGTAAPAYTPGAEAAFWRGTSWEVVAAETSLPPAKSATPLAFIELFTDEEQLAVATAAMQTPALRLWYDKLMAAQNVVFDDPRLLAGMGVLVTSGLITQARRDEILG